MLCDMPSNMNFYIISFTLFNPLNMSSVILYMPLYGFNQSIWVFNSSVLIALIQAHTLHRQMEYWLELLGHKPKKKGKLQSSHQVERKVALAKQ